MQRTAPPGEPGSGVALGLLDRAASALPAAVEENRHGWRLRHTDSSMWWAGATLAHGGPENEPLDARVRAAEEFYATHGAPARFQVCPECPPGLDTTLAARGYRWASPMSLQVATTAQIADQVSAPPLQVCLDDRPTAPWFEIWHAVHAADADPEPEWRLLRRIDRPSGYVTVLTGSQPVAVGRAVADNGWAGVFGMATLPHARGQGAATAVLAALARWAADQHAGHMYLQIEDVNAAAQRLYAAAGFAKTLTYHYRTAHSLD